MRSAKVGRICLFYFVQKAVIGVNCKECSRVKTCDIKEKPPTNCGRYRQFAIANEQVVIAVKVFDYLDREIRNNRPVHGPL